MSITQQFVLIGSFSTVKITELTYCINWMRFREPYWYQNSRQETGIYKVENQWLIRQKVLIFKQLRLFSLDTCSIVALSILTNNIHSCTIDFASKSAISIQANNFRTPAKSICATGKNSSSLLFTNLTKHCKIVTLVRPLCLFASLPASPVLSNYILQLTNGPLPSLHY